MMRQTEALTKIFKRKFSDDVKQNLKYFSFVLDRWNKYFDRQTNIWSHWREKKNILLNILSATWIPFGHLNVKFIKKHNFAGRY